MISEPRGSDVLGAPDAASALTAEALLEDEVQRLGSTTFRDELRAFPAKEIKAFDLDPEGARVYLLNSSDTPLSEEAIQDIADLLEIFSYRIGNRLGDRLFAIWVQPATAFEYDWQLGETKYGYITLSEDLLSGDALQFDYHGIGSSHSDLKIMACHEFGHVEDISFFGELGSDYGAYDPRKRVASTNFDEHPYWQSEDSEGRQPLTPYARRRNNPREDRADSVIYDVLGDSGKGNTLAQLDPERYALISQGLKNLIGTAIEGPPQAKLVVSE